MKVSKADYQKLLAQAHNAYPKPLSTNQVNLFVKSFEGGNYPGLDLQSAWISRLVEHANTWNNRTDGEVEVEGKAGQVFYSVKKYPKFYQYVLVFRVKGQSDLTIQGNLKTGSDIEAALNIRIAQLARQFLTEKVEDVKVPKAVQSTSGYIDLVKLKKPVDVTGWLVIFKQRLSDHGTSFNNKKLNAIVKAFKNGELEGVDSLAKLEAYILSNLNQL